MSVGSSGVAHNAASKMVMQGGVKTSMNVTVMRITFHVGFYRNELACTVLCQVNGIICYN